MLFLFKKFLFLHSQIYSELPAVRNKLYTIHHNRPVMLYLRTSLWKNQKLPLVINILLNHWLLLFH